MRLVGRLNLLGGAAVVAALIVGLGVLGALVRGEVLDLPAFDMNAERSVPTLFSGGLLLVAAGGAYVLGRSQESQGTRSWWVLALFLAFMSFDETMSVHERLQSRIGVTGQVLLAPAKPRSSVLNRKYPSLVVWRRPTDTQRPPRIAWTVTTGELPRASR